MKKLLLSLLAASSLFASKVIVLEHPFSSAKGSAIEVWAYMCGHCKAHFKLHTLDKVASANKLSKRELLSPIMGKSAKDLEPAFYYAEYLDLKNNADTKNSLYNKLKAEIFAANIDDQSEYEKIIRRVLGKSLQDIKELKDEPWYMHLSADRASIDEVCKVHGTPGYVINGKYLINLAEISSTEEFMKIAKELALKDN